MTAMQNSANWQRFQKYFLRYEDLGFSLDISRMGFSDSYLSEMEPKVTAAFNAMKELEGGAIANPDENRMVGHYWLRNISLAPAELQQTIEDTNASVLEFASKIHNGELVAANGQKFTDVLLVGIGGSALGPQFVADALGNAEDKMAIHFFDNTDPDGMLRAINSLGGKLATTLVVVISKSGGTKETRNGMLIAKTAFENAGIPFAKHAVAVTGDGSNLDNVAVKEEWLERFPMWDWVGGRTSVMSAVGLLPAALQGLDIVQFLAGAEAMDNHTRATETSNNAAMLLALMWHHAGGGKGLKDMVILPYKDRLLLFSKYLQQLVMESLGKELDLDGNKVNQGIAVYGNKGSTDQHAYVQQLRDGVDNFFMTFIEVRKSQDGSPLLVEPGITSGDYLQGFLRGTRTALSGNDRESMTISIPEVNAFQVGSLIALYERAVGFYATLVNINAYHQPGVEAGKKAAGEVLELQGKVFDALKEGSDKAFTADEVADKLSADPESIYHILCHLAANCGSVDTTTTSSPAEDTFSFRS